TVQRRDGTFSSAAPRPTASATTAGTIEPIERENTTRVGTGGDRGELSRIQVRRDARRQSALLLRREQLQNVRGDAYQLVHRSFGCGTENLLGRRRSRRIGVRDVVTRHGRPDRVQAHQIPTIERRNAVGLPSIEPE